MAQDRERLASLYETYNSLLTEHQRNILFDYYFDDLSMNEIAENQNVSKAAISDLINRSVKQLENYEKALGFLKIYEDLNNVINDMNNEDNQTIKNYSDRLNNILNGGK